MFFQNTGISDIYRIFLIKYLKPYHSIPETIKSRYRLKAGLRTDNVAGDERGIFLISFVSSYTSVIYYMCDHRQII